VEAVTYPARYIVVILIVKDVFGTAGVNGRNALLSVRFLKFLDQEQSVHSGQKAKIVLDQM